MDWNDIRYFLTVARHGSLSHAAAELGVTHVTVGRRIARLEQVHAVKLFERRQTGYSLTVEGQQLLIEAEQVEQACLDFNRQMAGQSREPRGRLTVSVQDTSVLDCSHLLRDFLAAYPQVDLVVLSTSATLNLNQGEADVVLRMTDSPPDLLVGRQLMQVPFLPAATQAYLDSIDHNLLNARWIIWQADQNDSSTEMALKERYPRVDIVMRTNSPAEQLAAVAAGVGVAVFSQPVIDNHPLLLPATEQPWVERPLWILTHRDLRNSAKVRAFMDFFSQRLGDNK